MRLILEQNNRVMEISGAGSKVAKRQHGHFDNNLLCADCDRKIGLIEQPVIEYCRKFDFRNNARAYDIEELSGLDPDLVCQFAVSIFWRASVSSIRQFDNVKLGLYERIAGDIVFCRLASRNCAELHVQMNVLFLSGVDLKSYIGVPIMVRNETGPYLLFSAGGFQWLVRFGKLPFGGARSREISSNLALNKSNASLAIVVPFNKLPDFDLYRQAAKADLSKP